MTLQLEQSLDREHSEKDFQRDIDAITSRQLSPENIDSYAEDALEDLVSVVEHAVASYDDNPTQDFETNKQREIAALRYFGLDADTVEQQLDHIADVADEIRELDKVISKITHRSNDVIVPPNPDATSIIPGDGSFEKKQVRPRLKTLLFVLSNDFDVDLHDEQQVRVTTGVLRGTMMRQESYNFVEVPVIDRTVLVCDEEGNITYVFDDKILERYDISPTDLRNLSKNDIDDLIKADGSLGCRIRYTNKYVPQVIAALTSPIDVSNEVASDRSGRYLQEMLDAPEGVLSARTLRELLGVHSTTLGRAIESIRDNLGEVHRYRFGNRVTEGYDSSQIELIKACLEQRELLVPDAPEGTLTFSKLREKFGVSQVTLKDAIDALEDRLGPVKRYRMGAKRKPSRGYDKDQQDIIAEYFISLGKLKPLAPDGVISLSRMSKSLKVDWETLENVARTLWGDLSDIEQYKFGPKTTYGFDKAQQAMIKNYLEAHTDIFVDDAPEGYMTVTGFAKHMHISITSVTKAIDALGQEIGESEIFRIGNKANQCYSPAQLQKISTYLVDKGYFSDEAPDGYMPVSSLASVMHVNYTSIKKAIQAIGENFGEMRIYRFGTAYAEGMSPRQQWMVQSLLAREKAEPAPDGILSKTGIVKKYSIDIGTVKRALKYVADELGEVNKYKFGQVKTEGYDETQQEIIRTWIENNTKSAKTKLGQTATRSLKT